MSSTTNTNPGNFANRDADEVKKIASMGGKASHGGHGHSHNDERKDSASEPGRNPDGTFTKGSEAAKQAGHLGGLHSHEHDGLAKEEAVSELEVQDGGAGRNADGTFTKGSAAASEAGKKGGHAHAAE